MKKKHILPKNLLEELYVFILYSEIFNKYDKKQLTTQTKTELWKTNYKVETAAVTEINVSVALLICVLCKSHIRTEGLLKLPHFFTDVEIQTT